MITYPPFELAKGWHQFSWVPEASGNDFFPTVSAIHASVAASRTTLETQKFRCFKRMHQDSGIVGIHAEIDRTCLVTSERICSQFLPPSLGRLSLLGQRHGRMRKDMTDQGFVYECGSHWSDGFQEVQDDSNLFIGWVNPSPWHHQYGSWIHPFPHRSRLDQNGQRQCSWAVQIHLKHFPSRRLHPPSSDSACKRKVKYLLDKGSHNCHDPTSARRPIQRLRRVSDQIFV